LRSDLTCATAVAPVGGASLEIAQSGSGLVRYLGIAPIASAPVRCLGGIQVTLLLEQRPEIERACGVAAGIRTPEGLDRTAAITLPFQ
jgi:hypothetical protein